MGVCFHWGICELIMVCRCCMELSRAVWSCLAPQVSGIIFPTLHHSRCPIYLHVSSKTPNPWWPVILSNLRGIWFRRNLILEKGRQKIETGLWGGSLFWYTSVKYSSAFCPWMKEVGKDHVDDAMCAVEDINSSSLAWKPVWSDIVRISFKPDESRSVARLLGLLSSQQQAICPY